MLLIELKMHLNQKRC